MTARLRAIGVLWALGAAGALGAACASEPPAGVHDPLDFAPAEGDIFPFDRNAVTDPGSFTDYESIDAPTIQRFLARTPYARRSFLETYQSNGIRASDAIASAARQYRINPLVLLVFAQTTEGLIGGRTYPFPPERIEYVFGCGCLEPGRCLPELAGFDRQVDCLGRALREALDELKVSEATTGGWGPDLTSVTLDNLKVTPGDEATAALYDRVPRVAEGKAGGTWLFWNVWNHFAQSLDYVGPVGSLDGRWIGQSCVQDAVCSAVEDAICATNYPDGLCTVRCDGACPSQPGQAESFCARFPGGGYCLPVCNPAAPSCRPGYACVRAVGLEDDETGYVCSAEAADR